MDGCSWCGSSRNTDWDEKPWPINIIYILDKISFVLKFMIACILLFSCGFDDFSRNSKRAVFSICIATAIYIITICSVWIILNISTIKWQLNKIGVRSLQKLFYNSSLDSKNGNYKVYNDYIFNMPITESYNSVDKFTIKRFNTAVNERNVFEVLVPTALSKETVDYFTKTNIQQTRRFQSLTYFPKFSESQKTFYTSVIHQNVFTRTQKKLENYASTTIDLPVFQVSVVLRNIGWCLVFVWSTTLAYRKNVEYNWKLEKHPYFTIVESAFLWVVTWDYILFLFSAHSLTRLPSIIDLLSLPIARLCLPTILRVESDVYVLYMGCLKFFRLVRLENTLTDVIPWISNVRLQVVAFFLGTTVLVLMFASVMFLLESSEASKFRSLVDYIYFAVVTISTVGYGDFAPEQTFSKYIVMLAITIALVFLPTYIQKFLNALQTPTTIIGKMPRENDEFIAILGPTIICREMVHIRPQLGSKILIITPESVVEYKSLIRIAFIKSKIKICALQNNDSPLSVTKRPKILFVVGRLSNTQFHGNIKRSNTENDFFYDDQNTYCQFSATQQIYWPTTPIFIQLHYDTINPIILGSASHLVALRNTAFKLLGKSCGCPGFSTLLSNFFHSPYPRSYADKNELQTINLNYKLYLNGSQYRIYQFELPECFYGLEFSIVAQLLLIKYKIYLIGFTISPKEFILNPLQSCIGDVIESKVPLQVAVVLSPCLLTIHHIKHLKVLDLTLLDHINKIYTDAKRFKNPKLNHFTNANSNLSNRMSTLENLHETFSIQSEIDHKEVVVKSRSGMFVAKNYHYARKHIFKNPFKELLLVCGWPRGLEAFLQTVKHTINCNIVILSPLELNFFSIDYLSRFNECCVWIEGSGLYIADLLRAGVSKARYCCIFDCSHTNSQNLLQSTCNQVLIIRDLIRTLYHTHVPTNKFTKKDTSSQTHCAEPFIILEMRSAEQMRYHCFNSGTTEKITSNMSVEELWYSMGAHVCHPEYMSGKIVLEEALYSLILFSYPVSQFNVNSSIIDYFISGKPVTNTLPNSEKSLILEKITSSFFDMEFGALYTYYIQYENKLPIAIYRPHTFDDSMLTSEEPLYLVISCPPIETKLISGDYVYIFKN